MIALFLTDGLRIKAETINFYHNLLGVAYPLCSSCDVSQLRALLPLKLNDDLHEILIVDVSREENLLPSKRCLK